MNVLSLFDGMSCGMIALDRLGIKVDNYYASEIDKYAMQVSAANYPEIIQVGDITKLDLSTLPKIDLVMGGSPCQGFSFAGKQLAFDDPRSALFFEFVKCVKELNPKYFLLENVKMKKEYLDIISEYMGVEPIFIQSSLVSAQSRQRYYWTNIPGIEQPEERGIVLRDILEDQVGSEHYVGDNMQKNYKGGNQLNPNYKSQANTIHNEDKKSGTICAGTHGYANGYVGDKHKPVKHTERNARHLKQLDDKSLCMTATMYKGAGNNGMTLVPQRLVDDTSDLPEKSQTIKSQYYKSSKANFEREGTFHATGIPQKQFDESLDKMTNNDSKSHKPKRIHLIPKEELNDFVRQRSVYSEEGKSPCLLARSDSPKIMKKETHDKPKQVGTAVDIKGHDQIKRVYSPNGKSPTVTTCGGGHREPKVVSGAYRGRYNDDGSTSQKLELTRDSKANAITTVQKDSVVTFSDKRIEKFKETLKENPQPSKNGIIQLNNPSHSSGRVYSPDGKSPTLMAGNSGGGKEPVKINDDMYWRKLTPLECERLQTVPDNYTNHVSNTQRYKMLGNGWTIEVIAHIFKNMEVTQ
jgi:DNA-cytosine methyltransferase